MDVVVTGASGLIGTALVDALGRAGHRPAKLVRRASRGADEISWDPKAKPRHIRRAHTPILR